MITAFYVSPDPADTCALICVQDEHTLKEFAHFVYGTCHLAWLCLQYRSTDKSQDKELIAAIDAAQLPQRATQEQWHVEGGLAVKLAAYCQAGKKAQAPSRTEARLVGALVGDTCICAGVVHPRKGHEFRFMWSRHDVRKFDKEIPWADHAMREDILARLAAVPEFTGKDPRIINGNVGRVLCLGMEQAFAARRR